MSDNEELEEQVLQNLLSELQSAKRSMTHLQKLWQEVGEVAAYGAENGQTAKECCERILEIMEDTCD